MSQGNSALKIFQWVISLYITLKNSIRTFPSPIMTSLAAQNTKSETSLGARKSERDYRIGGYTRGTLKMLLRSAGGLFTATVVGAYRLA